jgi:ring-1,2-phenylacetyl-CoA epoxidase subunit PaaD
VTADPTTTPAREAAAWRVLETVPDPEIPVVSVVDLGIARAVEVDSSGQQVTVMITPTYSGCPAMRMIEDDIRTALGAEFARVEVRTVLGPAWTTDWMSEQGRAALRAYGVAPPETPVAPAVAPAGRRSLPVLGTGRPAACPHCGATTTERVSEFGSTACKALYRCLSCREPFDYFKCH